MGLRAPWDTVELYKIEINRQDRMEDELRDFKIGGGVKTFIVCL